MPREMMYEIWIKEVTRVIGLRFKDKGTSDFNGLEGWRQYYDNKLTAHEAVIMCCGCRT